MDSNRNRLAPGRLIVPIMVLPVLVAVLAGCVSGSTVDRNNSTSGTSSRVREASSRSTGGHESTSRVSALSTRADSRQADHGAAITRGAAARQVPIDFWGKRTGDSTVE